MRVISTVILIFFLILEGFFVSFPLVLSLIAGAGSYVSSRYLFVVSFIAGIFLDIFYLRSIGQSSLFFICISFVIYIYDRKVERRTLPFVIFISFISSLMYLLIFDSRNFVVQIGLCMIFSAFVFSVLAVYREYGLGYKREKNNEARNSIWRKYKN